MTSFLKNYFFSHGKQLFPVLCLMLILSSCEQKTKSAKAAENNDVYYTCSMHPQVIEDRPGNCPVCGMKLIAVPKSSTAVSTQVRLSSEQVRLGNIQADTIRTGSIGNKMIFAGTLNFNLDKLSSVSARVEGRIER